MPVEISKEAQLLQSSWASDPRWRGIIRDYSAEDVCQVRGSVRVEHTLARLGSAKLWKLLSDCGASGFVSALGTMTGSQAVQQVKAGMSALYLSGWQVAGDNNDAQETYPDQSLYPANSAPALLRRFNNALLRADQIHHLESDNGIDWMVPIIADAEAGFGGLLNAYEIMKRFIEAGAAGVHFEDQLSSAKKCGHMGGKVLVPTRDAIQKLVAARLASDVMGVPIVLIARTDALAARMITSDIDEQDRPFLTGERSSEGHYYTQAGFKQAVARALAYAPYADMLWCETDTPDLDFARRLAEAVHQKYPGKMLSYNCSPSFNWKKNLDQASIRMFQRELALLGYKFQFVTLAGFHSLNYSMYELARKFREQHMEAYVDLQEDEFIAEAHGYTATRHQREVGASYFDTVVNVITGGSNSISALHGSTEEQQF